jgi:DDE superfamily endonuclease
VRQAEYDRCDATTAVCPATGQAAGLIAAGMDLPTINAFLAEMSMSSRLAPEVHAALIWDDAGSHTGKGVAVPADITPMALPPCPPELNPVEDLWHCFRSHHWPSRVYRDHEASLGAAVGAWRPVCLAPDLVGSIRACPYAETRT